MAEENNVINNLLEENEWHNSNVNYTTFATNEMVFDEEGMIKIEIIPSSAVGTRIILSSTEPPNPQVNDLWIQIE